MNFVGTLEGVETSVELKYCERCGGLFLRTPGEGAVYCAACAFRLAAEPDFEKTIHSWPRRRSRGARLANGPKEKPRLRGSGQIGYLQGVATAEARA
jgi:hypothetical protein